MLPSLCPHAWTHPCSSLLRLVPHLAENGETLSRTVAWVRRARAELSAVLHSWRSLEGGEGLIALSARADLHTCAAALDTGLGCVATAAAAGGKRYNVSLPPQGSGSHRAIEVLAEDVLSATTSNRVGTRAISLTAPAQTSGPWAPYSTVSRYIGLHSMQKTETIA